ncbi:hypothetical protein LPJ53_000527 [Coemansia erecta]|uniref:DUF7137 domain-containing protein n=1 Tax=Coemansia erecta TaxID=147472 RepID=A0A9W7Y5Y4_9FUNG|nr:hypothetical protein LPJ53_000527 [Coemansia erecta]
MRGLTLYRLFVAVALALFCLASTTSAQNDGGDSQDSATVTDADTTKATSASTSRRTSAQTEEATDNDNTDENTEDDQGELPNDANAGDDENSENDQNDDNDDDPAQSFDESYEETGLPQLITLTTPDLTTVPTPMFVIGEDVVIGWKYNKDTLRPPSKVSICGKFPKGSGKSINQAATCDWDIAVNISGTLRNYTWDTVTVGAPGIAFSEATSYNMYIYDSDSGPTNYTPGAGRVIPLQFVFNMYNSRYGLTNNGVPVGYNPVSSATNAAVHLWTVVGAIFLGAIANTDASKGTDPKGDSGSVASSDSKSDSSKADSAKNSANSSGDGKDSENRDLTLNSNGVLSLSPDTSSNSNDISLSGSNASPSASASSSNSFGISLNNNNNNNSGDSSSPSKTTSGSKSPSSTSSGSSNGQPGRIVMKTPPQSVESPLFEIASTVKLQWDYDNNMKKPPSLITIRGQMPSGYFQPGTTKPLYWYIAQNVSASPKAYNWDTITESPPGYTLREGTGYKLYIYDSDIGWDNSTHVYPGKLFQFMLPFSMYNSRYSQSNDGVPKNYNPNAGTRSVSVAAGAWTALVAAVLATFAL